MELDYKLTLADQLMLVWACLDDGEGNAWVPPTEKDVEPGRLQAIQVDLTEEEVKKQSNGDDLISFQWERLERFMWDLAMSENDLAKDLAERLATPKFSVADLRKEAQIGLLRAAKRYLPERGVPFRVYAQWWVEAQLKRATGQENEQKATESTTSRILPFGKRGDGS